MRRKLIGFAIISLISIATSGTISAGLAGCGEATTTTDMPVANHDLSMNNADEKQFTLTIAHKCF